MRDLKFRYYWKHDGTGEIWTKEYDLDDIQHGQVQGPDYTIRWDTISISQFTGLHDKNGTPIFEGDIVEFVGGTCSFLPCGNYSESHKIGTRLAVVCLKSGFTLRLESHLDNEIPNLVGNVHQYTFWNHARSLMVTGNIYEHKK